MKIAVTGASGAIATHLLPLLARQGHQVVKLVRRPTSAPDEITWDPAKRQLEPESLKGVDAVVHLAGAGIADKRWTEEYKALVLSSRVDGTTTISDAVAALAVSGDGPQVLLSGSAVGWYGDNGSTTVDETAPAGEGFLADVCVQWEAATASAEASGIRVCHLRTGIVLDAASGALKQQLLPFKLGIGGPLGNGRQYQPWIAMEDEVGAMVHLLTADSVRGAVNLTGPAPVTAKEFAKALGHEMGRPALFPIPKLAIRVVVGSFADELMFSQRAVPSVLLGSGYAFAAPTVGRALGLALG